jgi:hypothetical protein
LGNSSGDKTGSSVNSRQAIVHEVGHVVVGLEAGMIEDCIVFAGVKADEGACSFSKSDDPAKWIARSMGGIWAEILIAPEFVNKHLLKAYHHSVVLSHDHPYFEEFVNREKDFLPTSFDDMKIARKYATPLALDGDDYAICKLLRDGERRAREILIRRKDCVLQIIADVEAWLAEPVAQRGFAYPSITRARTIFEAN